NRLVLEEREVMLQPRLIEVGATRPLVELGKALEVDLHERVRALRGQDRGKGRLVSAGRVPAAVAVDLAPVLQQRRFEQQLGLLSCDRLPLRVRTERQPDQGKRYDQSPH